MMKLSGLLVFLMPILVACSSGEVITTYYFDSSNGSDSSDGSSPERALKSLSKLDEITLIPGDKVLLAAGQTFDEPLNLRNQKGSSDFPITISIFGSSPSTTKAYIATKGHLNGMLLENCSFIEVSNLDITAIGNNEEEERVGKSMRCGILITTSKPGIYEHLYLSNVNIHDVFYEGMEYKRPTGEVRTANGTQNYGWGIRVINTTADAYLKGLKIDSSQVENVAHTGIKLSGKQQVKGHSITDFQISNTKVVRTGGPGIQMSEVGNGHVFAMR